MGQNFLGCDREQELLLPPSLREWLLREHLAWFVIDAVGAIDLPRSTPAIGRMAMAARRTIRR